MANLQKKMKKDAKKLQSSLWGKKSLTLRHSWSFTTALYGNKKKKKPYFSVSMQGDWKISVFKLVMLLLGIGAAVTLVVLGVRALIENIRRKRFEEEFLDEGYFLDDDDAYNEDNGEELPF